MRLPSCPRWRPRRPERLRQTPRRARLPRGALAEAALATSGNASEESEPDAEQLPPRQKVTRQQRAACKIPHYRAVLLL